MITPDPSREVFYAWLRTHEDEVGALDDPSAMAGWQAAMAHMQTGCGGGQNSRESLQTRMDTGSTVGPNNGWQPIETAPKDGTEVCTFNGEQARMRWIEGPGYALWVWVDELLEDADPSPDQPTHWRPLPAAPKQEGGK